MDTSNLGLKRAAGVILWALRRGKSPSEAMAKAAFRQPDLSTKDLLNALIWAKRADDLETLGRLHSMPGMEMEEALACLDCDPEPIGPGNPSVGQMFGSVGLPDEYEEE